MSKFIDAKRLKGRDIDSAAILCDKGNLSGPTFAHIDPHPITQYRDHAFDVVYGISVMTHLEEKTEILCLEELKQIAQEAVSSIACGQRHRPALLKVYSIRIARLKLDVRREVFRKRSDLRLLDIS